MIESYISDLEEFLVRVDGKMESEWLAGEKEESTVLAQEGRTLLKTLRPDDVIDKLRNQDHLHIAKRIEKYVLRYEPPQVLVPLASMI